MRAPLAAALLLLSAACGGSSSQTPAPPPATALAFTVDPGLSTAVAPLSPAIKVEVRDASGRLVTGSAAAVTIALAPGGGAALISGTTTVAAVAGVATFSGLRLALAGTGYRLSASATGLTPATSASFDVAGGPPARLVLVTQPGDGRTSTPLTPPLQVRIEDAAGNLAVGDVDVTATLGSASPGGSLTGTTTATSTAGLASFPDLVIDDAGAFSLRVAMPGGAALTGSSFSLTDAWSPVGPGGGLLAVASDPIDGRQALAGGPGGVGLWRTVDGGGHWAPVPTLSGRSLRPVFERAGVAWAFGDSLWRSADGGSSWTEIPDINRSSDGAVVGLAFDPVSHAAVVAASDYEQRLLTSVDDGDTWTLVAPAFPAGATLLKLGAGPGGLLVLSTQGFHALAPGAPAWTEPVSVDAYPYFVVAHPTDPALLFVGGMSGLHRSADAGATWSVVSTGQHSDLWFDPAHPDTLLVGVYGGLLRSTDDGLSFDPLASPPLAQVASISGSPSRLYLGADTGPWVSTDAGVTFTAATTGLQAARFTAVAVSPATSGLVLAGAEPGSVFRSTDGGATWTSVLFMPAQAPLQITFDPKTPARVYLVNWGDLMVSTDAGATWGYLAGSPHGLNCLAVGGGASTTLWVGDQNGTGIWRSPDAGATWSQVYTRPSSSFIVSGVAADDASPLVAYLNQIDYTPGGPGTGLFRTSDGGVTWTKLAIPSYGPTLVAGPAAGELWELSRFDVQRSTDLGATFTSVWPSLNGIPRTLSFDAADGARAALGTQVQYSWLPVDGVQITTDSGATWRAARSGNARHSTSSVAIDPRAPATLYAATLGGGLLKTTTGGF